MAYDKVVDSAKLDADLTMVADAIRARAGTSEPLAFQEGMKNAVEGIKDTLIDDVLRKRLTHVYSNLNSLVNYSLQHYDKLVSVDFPKLDATYGYSFDSCTSLTDVNMPNLWKVSNGGFYNCTSLKKLDLPKLTAIATSAFGKCNLLDTLVFRMNQVVSLENLNAFNGTPFASGGTGGTVYCPAAQIQNYQTATNWSTLYAAGTCNFVAIEGSEYE